MKAFVSKLKNWQRKVHIGNIAMFDRLSSVTGSKEKNKELEDFKKLYVEHLHSSSNVTFSEFEKQEAMFVQNLFSASLNASGIADEIQNQYFDLKNDSFAHIFSHENSLSQF